MGETTTNMSLVDWLDDLTVRFLLNLPASELSSVPRLCFQVEEAQWFYEDFIRPAAAAAGQPLSSLPLRQFCLQLFQHCPLLSGFTDAQHIAAYEEFLAYKVRVPVRGAILLDESMEKLVLVKGWKKGASWSFPRGKINKDEKDLDCAVREVFEETGFDVRAAGLIPESETEAKYIDVTMREQHMRLFVFRGVSEETHFEPQTRKEISKIAWYNIRDLPGFKKQKHGAQEQVQHSNKFYMVAPFLGPLKKWINQQKRKDVQEAQIVAPGNEVAHASVEDEMEQAEEQIPEAPIVDNSAELKRLLSIGAPADTVAQQQPPSPVTNGGPSNNLLSLLRGGPSKPTNDVPQTPADHIHAFPPQPATPQPHHPRHPSAHVHDRPVPQFPYSPDRLQQQQRNFSVPTPGTFGPGPGGFAQGPHAPYPQVHPAHVQPQHFRQEQQRQSMPAGPLPTQGPQFAPQHGMLLNMPVRQPVQPPQEMPPTMPIQQQMPQYLSGPSDAFIAPQGPQGAISAGPAVPKATNLPMPNLNAYSLQLLNAFKSGSGEPTDSAANTSQAPPRQPSQHQAALLNLFRKPFSTQAPSARPTDATAEVPGSPTPTDTTERPARAQQERRPTLNEITRTLPAKLKVKSPAATERPVPPTQPPAPAPMSLPSTLPTTQSLERPKSRGQLYDPTAPKQPVPASEQIAHKPEQQTVPILQRPPPQHVPRSPKPGRSPKPKHASLKRLAGAAKGVENGTPQPAFTILTRPGSLRAEKSPAGVGVRESASPVRREETPKLNNERVAQGPPARQVLRRPESVDPVAVQKAAEVVEEGNAAGAIENGKDKTKQLLALFGKGGVSSPTPPQPAIAATVPGQPVEDRKNSLLNLFSGSVPRSGTGTPTAAMQPPPPPHIQPKRKPSSQKIHTRQQTPQNLLLDLFNRPSAGKLDSPGTPISPFTLGTPAQRQAPSSLASLASGKADALAKETTTDSSTVPANRNGNDNGDESKKGSGAVTPIEVKGFLLDYLNGVVKKEGYNGAKR